MTFHVVLPPTVKFVAQHEGRMTFAESELNAYAAKLLGNEKCALNHKPLGRGVRWARRARAVINYMHHVGVTRNGTRSSMIPSTP